MKQIIFNLVLILTLSGCSTYRFGGVSDWSGNTYSSSKGEEKWVTESLEKTAKNYPHLVEDPYDIYYQLGLHKSH